MIRSGSVAGLALVLCSLSFVACGGSSPAQPAPLPTPAPTPTPTPTPPPPPLSVIPPCPLPPSNPGASADCQAPKSKLIDDVNAAIDRAITERPDLFNLDDVDGGPRILNLNGYMTAVVSAINQAGLCGKIDAEGEIGIKSSNSFNEQWIIASKVGYWNPPGNWVRRYYVGACWPSTF